jgi:very-short-patch-repair endonuclease
LRSEEVIAALSKRARRRHGVFTGTDARKLGVSRNQLTRLTERGVVRRLLPDVYALVSVRASPEQTLRAALLWSGEESAAAATTAAYLYGLEGVAPPSMPQVAIPQSKRKHDRRVATIECRDMKKMMVRTFNGFRVVGVEACLVQLAAALDDDEALEIACEDARRRLLTGIPALRKYLDMHGGRGRDGVVRLRALLDELDPLHFSRSTLEVRTRRLLAASDLPRFEREVPLAWRGRTRYFDFGRPDDKLVLECNSKRWHDDPADYDDYNDKASIPGKLGWTIIFVTWDDVTKRPDKLLADIRDAVAAARTHRAR